MTRLEISTLEIARLEMSDLEMKSFREFGMALLGHRSYNSLTHTHACTHHTRTHTVSCPALFPASCLLACNKLLKAGNRDEHVIVHIPTPSTCMSEYQSSDDQALVA